MNIIVLGAGFVGSAIARDLAADGKFRVTSADISDNALSSVAATPGISVRNADISDQNTLCGLIADADIVIGAVPGYMGFQTLKTVIDAGKHIVDISFMPEDPFALDAFARERGVTAIVDCGLAPGLGNVLMGRASRELDEVSSFLCYVGGLPVVRRKPYEYAAVFSPVDVIEEYTRTARYLQDGRLVEAPALSDVELIEFPGIGTLEAFNTDGLRTLAVTMPAPNMKEKTMRYPGHAELMRILRDTGFFSTQVIGVQGARVRPLDVTAALLFPKWKLEEGEDDISVMRVIIEGRLRDRGYRREYNLLDRYDRATQTTSMARTTGYTCAMAARLLADGTWTLRGICPPEFIGRNTVSCEALLRGLRERGIVFTERVTESAIEASFR